MNKETLFSISDLRDMAKRYRDMASNIEHIVREFEKKESRFRLRVSDIKTSPGLFIDKRK